MRSTGMHVMTRILEKMLILGFFFFGLSTAAFAELVNHHGQLTDPNNSRACISCHDGSIGPDVLFCTTECDIAKGHVVFRRYPPPGKVKEFLPMAIALSRGIVFENGQVTCISCHNIRSSRPDHLVMDNRGSRLCLSCHIH